MDTNRSVWIMGCGDIGRRVARLYQNVGNPTIGWVNTDASVAQGQAQGIEMRKGDMDVGCFFPRNSFENRDIFWFVPPPSHGQIDSRLRRFLLAVQHAPKRIVLISTTGVYGDCAGRWIDESEPLKPTVERAKRRLDAETALREWMHTYNGNGVILRVPGIYAQNKLPIERIKRGEPILNAEQAPWTNRIHADDLAQICQVAMQHAKRGAIYNATDGNPTTMTDYFNRVADFAGLARPPQVDKSAASHAMSAGMLSYLQESRRIRNDKMLQELKITLQYPTLAAALAHKG